MKLYNATSVYDKLSYWLDGGCRYADLGCETYIHNLHKVFIAYLNYEVPEFVVEIDDVNTEYFTDPKLCIQFIEQHIY